MLVRLEDTAMGSKVLYSVLVHVPFEDFRNIVQGL